MPVFAPQGNRKIDFTHNFGDAVTVAGVIATVTLAGIQVSDSVALNCLSALPPAIGIANIRVTGADTLEVRFTAGATIPMGSMDWRLTVFR